MQSILAESAPRPGRAFAFAAVLAAVTSLALVMMPSHHRPTHRTHHQVPRIGKCVTYAYVGR